MAMTQMNTRLDEETKRRGDKVFAQLGLTPSEVVRAVWEYAADHEDVPAIVERALKTPSETADSLETSFRLALADAAGNLVSGYRQAIGAPPLDKLDVIDYRSLREEAWAEKLSERGLA